MEPKKLEEMTTAELKTLNNKLRSDYAILDSLALDLNIELNKRVDRLVTEIESL